MWARALLIAVVSLALSGFGGQVALAGSVPGKASGKIVGAPTTPVGSVGAGGTGTVSPAAEADPTGKFAKVCPKYPEKYAACVPTSSAPTVVPPAAPAVFCPVSIGTVGTAYSSAIGITEITALSVSFGVVGMLPPGLSLNPATGAIAGTPMTAGIYSFTATATNSAGNSGSASCSITVSFPTCTVTATNGCLVLNHVVVPGDATYGTSGTLTLDGIISFRTDCPGGCSGGAAGIGSYTISSGASPSSGTFTITGLQASFFIGTQYPFGLTCHINLPDNLQGALDAAPKVSRSQLKAGDVIFFQNTVQPGLSHVGIYIGKGKLVMAEWFQKGVRVVSLRKDPQDGRYWIAHYLTANRPWSSS